MDVSEMLWMKSGAGMGGVHIASPDSPSELQLSLLSAAPCFRAVWTLGL